MQRNRLVRPRYVPPPMTCVGSRKHEATPRPVARRAYLPPSRRIPRRAGRSSFSAVELLDDAFDVRGQTGVGALLGLLVGLFKVVHRVLALPLIGQRQSFREVAE